jgi:hypothetical protein
MMAPPKKAPPKPPLGCLAECRCYVDTKKANGQSNSASVSEKVRSLGGSIDLKFTIGEDDDDGTTHVVVSNNSTSKSACRAAEKAGIPIVTPEWILDCVKAGKRVPEGKYIHSEESLEALITTKGNPIPASSSGKKPKSKVPVSVLKPKSKVPVSVPTPSSNENERNNTSAGSSMNNHHNTAGTGSKSAMVSSSSYSSSSSSSSNNNKKREARVGGGEGDEGVIITPNPLTQGIMIPPSSSLPSGEGHLESDSDEDREGFPRWVTASVVDRGTSSSSSSCSSGSIKLRCQDAKRKTQFLVTEEEIPIPGWSMYYSEHYPKPNAASKTLKEAAAPDSVAKSEAKRQRLLSPSRTNRRSERISDQIPLSQDPGWLQDDEDFYDGDWGHLPNNTKAQTFVMPDLPRTKYDRDGVFDENNSNRIRSRSRSSGSGSHELPFFSCRDDSAGRPALSTKPGYNDSNYSSNSSRGKEDRDGESFQEDEFVGKYVFCYTIVLPSFLVCDVSVSLSIYHSLPAFSDTA